MGAKWTVNLQTAAWSSCGRVDQGNNVFSKKWTLI